MKNIILQHFDGELRELDKLSIDNISKYAERIGADYQLVTGKPFRSHLTSPCQKAIVIDERWDNYDNVLMIDPDMFVTKNNTDNVFDFVGYGTHGPVQKRLKERLVQLGRIKPQAAYWAGSFYKFDKQARQRIRDQMPLFDSWMNLYNKPYYYEDEGIIAELAWNARIPQYYVGIEWNQCSYLPDPDKAKMIHIRTKKQGHPNGSWDDGGKQDKILNYQYLVDKGIL